ncbi:MAG: hypothetical protein C5S44_11385 [Candidatus Methanocomedens sp.]|nr:MAG: hypothetical protein C5S44_11385 [ANME-2 cluster archaeon]
MTTAIMLVVLLALLAIMLVLISHVGMILQTWVGERSML